MLQHLSVQCDLCVIGGGLSGMAAAISAAREGLQVVLMHERPVLGGNASSEIRMWISGAQGRDNRETGLMEEIELENMYRNPTKNYPLWDTVLYDFVRREKNIKLLLNCTCMDARVEEGHFAHGRDRRILSVTGYQLTTQRFFTVEAKYFADCSGDSILAPLTGADFRLGREAASEFDEIVSTKVADQKTMGMSCLIQGRETERQVPYTPPPFAAKLKDKDFENRMPDMNEPSENFWYLELGGNRDTIHDTEELRDELVALAAGTWDYVKNSGHFAADNWELDFLGFLPGKRESRRMMGETIITQRDISDGRIYEDEVAYGGWWLDDHFPDGFYHRGVPNTNFATPAPYSLPYRALYSRNVDNLFFAGRNISTTHMAMSSIRVMATCALLGEAVGRAAAIAVEKGCTPHDVYLRHMDDMQQRLMQGDCFLPNHVRRVSDVCRHAALTGAGDYIRNGQDRAHPKYGTDESAYVYMKPGDEVTYRFPEAKVKSIHLVFSSDVNRDSLPGEYVDRVRSTRCNLRLDAPHQHLPPMLCRSFAVVGVKDGAETELFRVEDNRKRCHHIKVDQPFDTLTLKVLSGWGSESIQLISFDFEA